ncbi:MAG: hypothetical protein A3H91_17575 [Gammaproteobacteria bacterium RIFCSPLOWO2_02_FULL_61_13]|nr:MAG: hypothetical protein A3H91_17575 [Gammaproteobacteria bacterium RIFCSPLOWO2_02_FULL_61_13]
MKPAVRALALSAVLAAASALHTASAQGYPARPVRIIIPSAPGGPSDTNGRDIVQRLNAEVSRNLLNNPVLQEKFLSSQGLGAESPVGESPEAFAAFLKVDREYFATVIKATEIKFD